jgi:hypothetical protein
MFTGPNTITNGLVLSLDAANVKSYVNGSTTWRDLSGNRNNGTLTNGPTFNSANLGSIVFDGTNDYVLDSTVNYNNYSNNFTAITWVKTNTINGGIMGWGSGGVPPYYTWALSLSDSKFATQIYNGANYFINSDTIEINKWYSVTFVVYQSGLMELYINNVKYSTVGSSNLIRSRDDQYNRTIIGANPNIDLSTLNGNIASTQIYNRALSASEIFQNYEGQKSRYNPE